MKFSKKWLDEWLGAEVSVPVLVERLNQSGLEVDSVKSASSVFSGIKVARIESCEKHPDAKKLSVCSVDVGDGKPLQVVCGASNVRAGLKVAFATVGAKLGEDFEIKATELRGVASEGMICSASELGLEESSDGILELADSADVGTPLESYLGLPDDIVELDLTPNRADCLGLKGLAREVGAITESPYTGLEVKAVAAAIDDSVPVEIEAPHACHRYCGRVIRGIDLNKSSPIWLIEKLRRSGIRAISPVVDVTNYVMLELGQPMHAFDLAKIAGGIRVRLANPGEKLILLDDREVSIKEDTLLISDQDKPLALAGIMGGLASSVTDDTVDIFLESAAFVPAFHAGKARAYNMHTDSSHRFERGVDPGVSLDAIERATGLLIDIVGGTPGPVVDVKSLEFDDSGSSLTLRYKQVERILGATIPQETISTLFDRLGFESSFDEDAGSWSVTAPSFRFDIAIEADLIEEIARLYGYDNIHAQTPHIGMGGKAVPERVTSERTVYDYMRTQGVNEIISYSFISPDLQRHFNVADERLRLVNPIASDLSEMRMSLWPQLLQGACYNRARRQNDVRLFESGLVFDVEDGELIQRRSIAGLLVGASLSANWNRKSEQINFFDVKGMVEGLLALTKAHEAYRFEPREIAGLHPGQSAVVTDPIGRTVARVGILHPALENELDILGPVALFEIDWSVFDNCAIPKAKPVSKFPTISRDLSVLVDRNLHSDKLIATVRQESGLFYDDCYIFDVYEGKGITTDKKSVALAIELQCLDKTFTDEEIQQIMERILHELKSEHGAELRE